MSKWKWANDVLYSMCKAKPEHKEDEVIIGKICLIGRATAAAIERRREDYVEEDEDFYLEKVAPMISASSIDTWIDRTQHVDYLTRDNMKPVLYAHHELTKLFSEISGLNKSSLASKYLHFHMPNAFFILDSIVERSLAKKITSRVYIRELEKYGIKLDHINDRCARYILRCLDYRDNLSKKNQGRKFTPRDIDDILFDRFADGPVETAEL
jgi:hypothetical protein